MHWELLVDGEDTLHLRVDQEFLDWLRSRVSDHEVAQIDPFRDTVFDKRLQERWIAALRAVREALHGDIRMSIEKRRLPTDPQGREVVVRQLMERELAGHPWIGLLDEVVALFELAKSNQALVRAFGD